MPALTRFKPTKTHPFAGRDVPWLLENKARMRADHPFLIWTPFEGVGATWTYSEFAKDVAGVAAGLVARGVKSGDPVVIHMGNCPEFLMSWFACSWMGAVAVTTNTRSTAGELAYFIEYSRAVAVITQPALLDATLSGAAGSPIVRFVVCTTTDLGATPTVTAPAEVIRFEDIASIAPAIAAVRSDSLSPNSIQFTSGTTARPKGVVWTHANALWGAKMGASLLDLSPDDVTLIFLPLYHTNALSYSMLSTLWSGGTIVLQPRFSASRYWDTVIEHGCTWTSSIPFMIMALAEQPMPGAHKLRFWGLGASDIGIAKKFWNLPTLGWFGMTETITLCIMAEHRLPNRPMAMGVPVAGYDIRILRDDGTEVDFGESGWLKIRGLRGVSLFSEYLHNPEATDAAFDDEDWFDTGDLVTPFEDGHIRFDNRGKDMLRVGAENVSAAEVERIIGAVAGVREVAVVGKPHKMLDEVPVAFVIAFAPDAGLSERVLTACRVNLADFKVPVEVIIVDEFPRVTLEKVDKKVLRQRLLQS